ERKSVRDWVEDANVQKQAPGVVVRSVGDYEAATVRELLTCWRPLLWCELFVCVSLHDSNIHKFVHVSMNLGFESSNIGHSLGVKEFMYKFGYEISPGKWVIRFQDQQALSAVAAVGLGSAYKGHQTLTLIWG
ncbi:hypothetical protein V1524DRAFT_443868, partial [Lipomyces starkeyi]